MPAKAGIQYPPRERIGRGTATNDDRRLLGRPVKPGDDTEIGAMSVSIYYAALLGAKLGWITAPSRVSAVALTISSSHLTASALLLLSTRISRKA